MSEKTDVVLRYSFYEIFRRKFNNLNNPLLIDDTIYFAYPDKNFFGTFEELIENEEEFKWVMSKKFIFYVIENSPASEYCYDFQEKGLNIEVITGPENPFEEKPYPKAIYKKGKIITKYENRTVINENFKRFLDMASKNLILNPPYNGDLHLEILKSIVEVESKKPNFDIICIHPASFLIFPTRKRPEFMNGIIYDFDVINRSLSNEYFGINDKDLVITHLQNNGLSFSGNSIDDPNFCCFKLNPRFKDCYQNVCSIWKKVTIKHPVDKIKTVSYTTPNSEFPLKYYITRAVTSDANTKGGNKGFRLVTKVQSTAFDGKTGAGCKFLNFNTAITRNNAWESYLTKFSRFCIAMDESIKLALYMDDYTEPWTNKRFCDYFGITGYIDDEHAVHNSEWETILNVINKVK